MIDEYIIMNRKPKAIIIIFWINITLLLMLVIFCINTCYYCSYVSFHSQILCVDSFCFLEVLVPVEEVNLITSKNVLVLGDNSYIYNIVNIDSNVTYENDINYQKVYLDVANLDNKFLVNGYRAEVKIIKENKKIKDYL